MQKILFALVFLFSTQLFAEPIGFFKQVKGDVLLYKRLMGVNDPVEAGDVISTGAGSFAKIELKDQTVITLGPSSEFDFTQYQNPAGDRDSLYNIVKGQVRVHVMKKAGPKEKIKFTSGVVALGVRGTEFLVNAYQAASKATSDIALVTGELAVSGEGVKPFALKAGEYFNSSELLAKGSAAVQKLTPEMLQKIKNDFMPNLQSPTGAMIGMGAALGMAAAIVPSSNEKEKAVAQVLPTEENKEQPAQVSKNGFNYDLAKEPWDIRDNVMKRDEYKTKNECFFYFYKKLPGAGEEERFRRTRDCEDFEFDL